MKTIWLLPCSVEAIDAKYKLDNGRTIAVTCSRTDGWFQSGASEKLLQRTVPLTEALQEALTTHGEFGCESAKADSGRCRYCGGYGAANDRTRRRLTGNAEAEYRSCNACQETGHNVLG